jgi:hypothetical protein
MNLTSSVIKNNKAVNGSGGALYFSCNEEPTDICSLSIRLTDFKNNTAINGGGIMWDYREPLISTGTTFTNNNASKYGHDLASFA